MSVAPWVTGEAAGGCCAGVRGCQIGSQGAEWMIDGANWACILVRVRDAG